MIGPVVDSELRGGACGISRTDATSRWVVPSRSTGAALECQLVTAAAAAETLPESARSIDPARAAGLTKLLEPPPVARPLDPHM